MQNAELSPSQNKTGVIGTSGDGFLSLWSMEERFWMLASMTLAGEASPEESAELEEMLRQNPEWALRLEIMSNIWRSADLGTSRRTEAYDRHLQRFSAHLSAPALQYEQPMEKEGRMQDPDRGNDFATAATSNATEGGREVGHPVSRRGVPFLRLFWGAAAAVGGIIFFTYSYYARKEGLRNTMANTVSTRPGSRSRVQLPDGTQVWLNADSRITFNAAFTGLSREVELSGEAYFDVAKEKDHPFIIHTPSIDVRVLGTSFDIRSYNNERNTEADLFQGSVEVTLRNNPDKKIVLKPNEKLVIHNDSLIPSNDVNREPGRGSHRDDREEPMITLGKVHFQKKDSSVTEILWVRNQLAFDGVTLEEAALQIERWYGVKIIIRDDILRRTAYSAVFEDETLIQVMEALRLSGNFHYTIHKKELIITR
jgi:transmembrane sensor